MKKFILSLLLTLISLSVFSQKNDSIQKITPTRISINPPKILNFKETQIRDSISLTKFSLKRSYRKLTYKERNKEGKEIFKSLGIKNLMNDSNTVSFQDQSLKYVPRKTYNKNSPDTLLTFNGTYEFYQKFPPDISIAVGNDHIMEVTNSYVKIYDKNGNSINQLTMNQFFASDSNEVSAFSDPRIFYDIQKNRWVATCMGSKWINVGDYRSHILMMVSQSEDPTKNWYQYDILVAGGIFEDSLDVPDYPQIGYNKNWVVINSFLVHTYQNIGGQYALFHIFNKDSLYSGNIDNVNTIYDYYSILGAPSQTIDTTTDTEYLIWNFNSNTEVVNYISGTPSNPVLNTDISKFKFLYFKDLIPVNTFGGKQNGSNDFLYLNDNRIQNVVYINNSLWFCHTASTITDLQGSKGVIFWGQYDPINNKMIQSGIIENDSIPSVQYAFPQISVNRNNDALIVFSRTSLSYNPSISYAYRSASDPLNTFRNPRTYKWGLSAQERDPNRWGDYFGCTIDPVDSSFWVSGESYDNTKTVVPNDSWLTTLGHVDRVDPCFTPKNLVTSSENPTSVTLSWESSYNDTAYLVSYREVNKNLWINDTVYRTYKTLIDLSQYTKYQCTVQSFCPEGSSNPVIISFGTQPDECRDIYEPNDGIRMGKNLNPYVNIYGTIGRKYDRDFYRFKITNPNKNVNIVLQNLTQDYDLYLYDKNGSVITFSSNSGTSNEEIYYNNLKPGFYYILVKSKVSTVFDPYNCYDLRLNTSSSPY